MRNAREAPVAHFAESWRTMSHFKWQGTVLYQGQVMQATALPWHYALVWVGLTVPLLYLLFFALGAGGIGRQVVRRGWQLYARDAEWQDLLFLGLALAPLAAIIALHSVLYNGWRQLYFLYPMLLLVALRGLVAAWRWQPAAPAGARYWRPALGLAVGLGLAVIAGRMVRLHPFEHMYFNALAPTAAERYYDGDYWGLSFSQGLDWVVRHDARPHIKVFSSRLQPITLNYFVQPAASRARLELAPTAAQADYVLENYSYQQPVPYGPPSYSVQAEGRRLLDVYQLH